MNSMWLAGLLTLLLAPPPRAQDAKPAEGDPRVHEHPGGGVSSDPTTTCA